MCAQNSESTYEFLYAYVCAVNGDPLSLVMSNKDSINCRWCKNRWTNWVRMLGKSETSLEHSFTHFARSHLYRAINIVQPSVQINRMTLHVYYLNYIGLVLAKICVLVFTRDKDKKNIQSQVQLLFFPETTGIISEYVSHHFPAIRWKTVQIRYQRYMSHRIFVH